MERMEQIKAQEAEIELKSSGVRSKVPIKTYLKRYLKKERGREWISDETWKKIDKRKAAKNDANAAKTEELDEECQWKVSGRRQRSREKMQGGQTDVCK